MKTLKTIAIIGIVVVVFSICSVIGFAVYVRAVDGPPPPTPPTESEQGTVVLTSTGCCFSIEDVDVYLQSSDGQRTLLSHTDAIYENDIFEYTVPDLPQGPIQLFVSFRSYYGDECDFSMPVMEFESIEALKETGVLLFFKEGDDMYFNVIAGASHLSYQRGPAENRWVLAGAC